GRVHECGLLDRLLEAVRGGESGALVVRGEPGVGKSALLEYVAGRASGCRVARAAGVQSEMELAYSGLDQLCAPMLDRIDRLPEPQRNALRTAFGLAGGRRLIAFWLVWRCLGCCPTWPARHRWCVWWMTPSGSIRPRRRRWHLSRAVWWQSRSPWSLPCASRATNRISRDYRSWRSAVWVRRMRGRCWPR